MAEIVQTLLSFPPDSKESLTPKQYDTKINHYLKDLRKFQPAQWTKKYEKKELIELLDPSVNSIAYLISLCELIKANSKDKKRIDQLIFNAVGFFTSFDPVQVRYVGNEWRMLLEWTIDYFVKHPVDDVTTISTAILRLDPTAGTFTNNHLAFLELCLKLGVPSQALPILDRDIYAYPQKYQKSVPEELLSEEHEFSNAYITEKSGFVEKLDSSDVLQYYLLGAQVYIAVRNYSRARLFLEFVLLAPSQQHATSALQVEAYKRWLLLGLLAEGRQYPQPKTLDQTTLKNVKACSRAYEAVAHAFSKRESQKLVAEVQTGQEIWTEDGNLRLVDEVVTALQRYRVIDLQKTYAALPVTRVASLLEAQPGDTLQHLQEMIGGGFLNASVSGSSTDAILRFHDTASIAPIDIDLAAQTERIQKLVAFIREADRRLQLTKEYVEHQKRQKRSAGADGDLADVMDLTWDAPNASNTNDDDGDEDIMAS
ncbi:hypothetical protein AC578_6146 [Pseudocercospora eumusae]|uniref:COP9 signalosome complex subunit 3 N-terminal helical repeats domain-containing protein n=1 Tax=Pseudocercospora eumusae TaxID=321146 RepID=A0A139H9A6_9PEZI|nr:hypothetical protein AC578_6146 [Pseudocercospora eumusae]